MTNQKNFCGNRAGGGIVITYKQRYDKPGKCLSVVITWSWSLPVSIIRGVENGKRIALSEGGL